jgi:hypothetical protein
MSCDNYYSRPYFWLLMLTIILFLIFIVVIETNQSFTNFGIMSTSSWVLLIIIIIIFITCLIWYYYDSLKPCPVTYVVSNVQQLTNTPMQEVYEHREEKHCSLEEVYDEPKISFIEDEYLPLSALNPFK